MRDVKPQVMSDELHDWLERYLGDDLFNACQELEANGIIEYVTIDGVPGYRVTDKGKRRGALWFWEELP